MNLKNFLRQNSNLFGRVISLDYNSCPAFIFDFSRKNKELQKTRLTGTQEFSNYIFNTLKKNNAGFGIGKYNENRIIYQSDLFSGKEKRTIHLGIDLWVPPETSVLAPLKGIVHSFANNEGDGDYGPTIILEHNLNSIKFYTLYGHLSIDSLNNLKVGKVFEKGEIIGKVGNFPDNGNWPSHLHFQIIKDMQGKCGDFPGVASKEKAKEFLEICPDPNLILGIKELRNSS